MSRFSTPSRQAEAERERRAKIINAEAEFQASSRLAEAADIISRNPTTLQLRYLQTLGELGGESTSTVVFPVPIDLIRPFLAGDAVPAPSTSSERPALRGRSDMESLIAGWTSVQADAQRATK